MPQGAQDERRLGIGECRKLIGDDCDLSDKQVETLRDQSYALAHVAVTEYVTRTHNRTTRKDGNSVAAVDALSKAA